MNFADKVQECFNEGNEENIEALKEKKEQLSEKWEKLRVDNRKLWLGIWLCKFIKHREISNASLYRFQKEPEEEIEKSPPLCHFFLFVLIFAIALFLSFRYLIRQNTVS